MASIRERREELHFSQKELAEKCGIAPTTLSDIEAGRKNPSLPVAIKIAAALEVKDINFFNNNVG